MAVINGDDDLIHGEELSAPGGASLELPDTDDITELAKAATPTAIKALINIVTDRRSADRAKIAAASAIIDRAHGKPHQSTSLSGGANINIICNIPAAPNTIKHEPVTIEHKPE